MKCNFRIESDRALLELPVDALPILGQPRARTDVLEAVTQGNQVVLRPVFNPWDFLEQELFGEGASKEIAA